MKNLTAKNFVLAIFLALSAITLSACGNSQGGGGGGAGGAGGAGGGTNNVSESDNSAPTDADFERLCKKLVACKNESTVRDCVLMMKDILKGGTTCHIKAMECAVDARCTAPKGGGEAGVSQAFVTCLLQHRCQDLPSKDDTGPTGREYLTGFEFCSTLVLHSAAYESDGLVASKECDIRKEESYEKHKKIGVDVMNACSYEELKEYSSCLVQKSIPPSKANIGECKHKLKSSCQNKLDSYMVNK